MQDRRTFVSPFVRPRCLAAAAAAAPAAGKAKSVHPWKAILAGKFVFNGFDARESEEWGQNEIASCELQRRQSCS